MRRCAIHGVEFWIVCERCCLDAIVRAGRALLGEDWHAPKPCTECGVHEARFPGGPCEFCFGELGVGG